MLRNTIIIAKNTFRETMRDRILIAALGLALAIIVFSLFIGSISLEQDVRMIADFGTTAIYILQMFVAIFIGSMLIYKEIEQKTFYLIIPKPIKRHEIILGKCLGLTTTTLLVALLSTIVLIIMLYIKGGTSFLLPIITSLYLGTLEAMLLILLSILFSGLTSPIMSAIFTISLYVVGHSSDVIRTLAELAKLSQLALAEVALRCIYYILPNLNKFNIRNTIVNESSISLHGVIFATLYALVYAAILFYLATIMFKKKEF
jgi:ABC-type transport system involved in multi-copper enzyme maturation permease subunit